MVCRHKLFEPAHELLARVISSPVLRGIGCHLVGELIHHATILLQDVNEQVGALLIRWAGRFKVQTLGYQVRGAVGACTCSS